MLNLAFLIKTSTHRGEPATSVLIKLNRKQKNFILKTIFMKFKIKGLKLGFVNESETRWIIYF